MPIPKEAPDTTDIRYRVRVPVPSLIYMFLQYQHGTIRLYYVTGDQRPVSQHTTAQLLQSTCFIPWHRSSSCHPPPLYTPVKKAQVQLMALRGDEDVRQRRLTAGGERHLLDAGPPHLFLHPPAHAADVASLCGEGGEGHIYLVPLILTISLLH